jgi:hypothetical protein
MNQLRFPFFPFHRNQPYASAGYGIYLILPVSGVVPETFLKGDARNRVTGESGDRLSGNGTSSR